MVALFIVQSLALTSTEQVEALHASALSEQERWNSTPLSDGTPSIVTSRCDSVVLYVSDISLADMITFLQACSQALGLVPFYRPCLSPDSSGD